MRLHTFLFFLFIEFEVMILLVSCSNWKRQPANEKIYSTPCGCLLSEQQMIYLCPIDAVGDSILICKVGTNNVIGSNRPPMTWTEFMQSEYFGDEGLLINCKTGDTLIPNVHSPMLSYRNKKLIVDEGIRFDVYDSRKNTWIDLEIPVWRKVVSSVNSEIKISLDSLIFKPPFLNSAAIANVAGEYEKEEKRIDHYLIPTTGRKLLLCSLSGDTLSEKRLLSLQTKFSDYYQNHPDSKEMLDEDIRLFKAYKSYLKNGGKQEYFDLTIFPYFQNAKKPINNK